jgi:hypothetical protein
VSRFAIWTVAVLAFAALALFDMVSGWTTRLGVLGVGLLLGLFAVGIGLYVAMILAGLHDRRKLRAAPPDAPTVLTHVGRAIRWCGLFAVGAAVMLFASCTGPLTPAQTVQITSIQIDPGAFTRQALILELPLLLALILPPALATAAQLRASRRMARLAIWSVFLLLPVCILSVIAGLATGVATCGEFGPPSVGACAAGAGATTNLVSLLALALYVPYTTQAEKAVAAIT